MFTIGIDLDNTLIKCNIVEMTAKEFNFDLSKLEFQDWKFTNFPIELKTEIYKRFSNPYYMTTEPFISFMSMDYLKLKKWKDEGHRIVLITAREKSIEAETKSMVRKRIFNFDKIYFSKNKKIIFNNEKLDIWIDDNPEDCKSALTLGIKTYLIQNKDTKYNHNMKNNLKLTKVKSVSDIEL